MWSIISMAASERCEISNTRTGQQSLRDIQLDTLVLRIGVRVVEHASPHVSLLVLPLSRLPCAVGKSISGGPDCTNILMHEWLQDRRLVVFSAQLYMMYWYVLVPSFTALPCMGSPIVGPYDGVYVRQ